MDYCVGVVWLCHVGALARLATTKTINFFSAHTHTRGCAQPARLEARVLSADNESYQPSGHLALRNVLQRVTLRTPAITDVSK